MNTPSVREMADQYPGSVWQSLVNRADWMKELRISSVARRLTRLQGPQFYNAVKKIIDVAYVGNA